MSQGQFQHGCGGATLPQTTSESDHPHHVAPERIGDALRQRLSDASRFQPNRRGPDDAGKRPEQASCRHLSSFRPRCAQKTHDDQPTRTRRNRDQLDPTLFCSSGPPSTFLANPRPGQARPSCSVQGATLSPKPLGRLEPIAVDAVDAGVRPESGWLGEQDGEVLDA